MKPLFNPPTWFRIATYVLALWLNLPLGVDGYLTEVVLISFIFFSDFNRRGKK